MAFVVEDGSGLATANSYIAVADADTYVTDYIRNASTWVALSTANKQSYLREATQTVDLLFGRRWTGYRKDVSQGLDWPRSAGYDTDGYSIDGNIVPSTVEVATVELAWRHLNDSGPSTTTGDSTGMIPDVAAGKNIGSESVSAGSIKTSTTYTGMKSYAKFFRKVELILQKLILPRGAIDRS